MEVSGLRGGISEKGVICSKLLKKKPKTDVCRFMQNFLDLLAEKKVCNSKFLEKSNVPIKVHFV